MITSPEILWLERAAELAEAANQALRASCECLREAEQARLTAERERPLAGDWKSSAPGQGTTGESERAELDAGSVPATTRGEVFGDSYSLTNVTAALSPAEDSDSAERESPFAGSRDPGAAPAVLGSPHLEYPHLWTLRNEWNTSELRDIRISGSSE